MRTRNMCTNGEVGLTFFFGLFITRMQPMDIMARIYTVRFPIRCPRSGGSLQVPLYPPPLTFPQKKKKMVDTPKEITKGKKQRKSVPRLPTPCLSTP